MRYCTVATMLRKNVPAAVAALFVGQPCVAEVRTYTYNARGELVASAVTGGPANGVQTSTTFDAAGNRTAFTTSGSTAPIRFPLPILTPLSGGRVINIPQ